MGAGSTPTVAALLPARNAIDLLEGWFAAIDGLVDVVVALDDGSTDDTATALEGHRLVAEVLRNPGRDSYAGWDDAANRNRLLKAADAVDPDWVLFVDADERFAPGDARALRAFIDGSATEGYAYGFPTHRMIGDLDHHDGVESHSFRLFAHDPDHRLAPARLHHEPVPTAIPRGRWLSTNIRLQHLGTMTEAARRARRAKYAQADPGDRWTDDPGHLDEAPRRVRPFRPRPEGAPVLLSSRHDDPTLPEPAADWPLLTVVSIVDDANVEEMARFWARTAASTDHHDVEQLVIARTEPVADDIGWSCPGVTVVSRPGGSTGAAAANAGLRLARGDYVVCLDAPADVADGGWRTVVDIHDRGNAVVVCPSVNDTRSAAGWASWLRAPERCSFAREILVRAGGFEEDLGDWRDHEARRRLVDDGHHVGHAPRVRTRHRTSLEHRGAYLDRCRELALVRARRADGEVSLVAPSAARDEARLPSTTGLGLDDRQEREVRSLLLRGRRAAATAVAREAVAGRVRALRHRER